MGNCVVSLWYVLLKIIICLCHTPLQYHWCCMASYFIISAVTHFTQLSAWLTYVFQFFIHCLLSINFVVKRTDLLCASSFCIAFVIWLFCIVFINMYFRVSFLFTVHTYTPQLMYYSLFPLIIKILLILINASQTMSWVSLHGETFMWLYTRPIDNSDTCAKSISYITPSYLLHDDDWMH